MKRILVLVVRLAVSTTMTVALQGACNNVGTCPTASSIAPGGSCNGDNLQCPYSLETLSPACDGTTVEGGLQTSCVCTKGAWTCPSPVSCGSGDTAEGGAETGDNGAEDAGGGSDDVVSD